MILIAKDSITVTIAHRSELEQSLNSAVDGLLAPARQLKQGVLVTRRGPALFEVSLSDKVPYGTTLETVSW